MTAGRRGVRLLPGLLCLAALGTFALRASAARPPQPGRVRELLRIMSAGPRYEIQAERLREAFHLFRALPPAQQQPLASELGETARAVLFWWWREPGVCLEQGRDLVRLDEEQEPPPDGASHARWKAVLALDTSFLGAAYYYQRAYDQAFQTHDRAIRLALETGDADLLGRCYKNRAVVHNFRGEMIQATDDWRRALHYYQAARDRTGEARARVELGSWLVAAGELEPAWSHLQRAEELVDAALRVPGVPDWVNLISVRTECRASLAEFYRKTGRPREALQWYEQASLDTRLTAIDRQAIFFVEMADILVRLGDPDSEARAERYYEIALMASPAHQDPWNAMHSRAGYAELLARNGRYREAADLLEEGLRIARANGDLAHETSCLLLQGDVALRQEPPDPTSALARFDECLALAERSLRTPEFLWRAHHGRARALEALGRRQESLETYEKALAVIEGWLHGAQDAPQEAVRLDGSVWEPFEDAAAAYARLGNAERVYALSERLKGALLAEAFNRTEIHRHLSPQDRDQEQRLRTRVAEARRAYLSHDSDERRGRPGEAERLRGELDRALERAETDYDRFRQALYRRAPDLQAARGSLQPVSLQQARELAGQEETTIVSYLLTREGVAALVIDARGCALYRIPVKAGALKTQVAKLAEAYQDRRKVRASRSVTFPRAAVPLYDALVRPLEARLRGARSLCVIPDDYLWGVPFELLWTDTAAGPRYLVESFPITYAPSVAALAHLRIPAAGSSVASASIPERAAALVNPVASSEAVGNPMRSGAFAPRLAVRETAVLREQFRATVFEGAKASPQAALAALRDYDLVHFGCHGLYDDREPLHSILGLGNGLTAEQLANAEIRARLVVLAACETGRGEPARGQGLLGLTWAAFVGGARTCVATRWQVDDAATAALFDQFYREIRRGRKGSEALQAAQIKLLHDDAFAAPYYWSGVMLVGR